VVLNLDTVNEEEKNFAPSNWADKTVKKCLELNYVEKFIYVNKELFVQFI